MSRLLRAAFDSPSMLGARISLQELQEFMASSGDIQAWIAEQLGIAANNPGEDILTSIGRGGESEALSKLEAIVILQTLLSAGGESTTSLLGNATYILANRQDLQQQLRAQPECIPSFVEEVLRIESPFRHHMRFAPRATTLGGMDIPAGATVLLFWAAANRDPAEFKNPDEFIIDRKPRRHVTFGRGIHHCIGASLARLEAKVVLTVLLEQTSSITLDPNQPPEWVDSLQVRRYERLPVLLVPRT